MLINHDAIAILRPRRAGVIPYYKTDETIYFLLGIDRVTNQIADMGGGCKLGEFAISTGIRELQEESNYCISPHDLKPIQVGVWEPATRNCILFAEVHTESVWKDVVKTFASSNKPSVECEEMSALVWLSREEMTKCIYSEGNTVWSKTRETLANCGNFSDILLAQL